MAQHLKIIQDLVIQTRATRVALDALSTLARINSIDKFGEFVIGLSAFLKMQNCTSLFTFTTSQSLGTAEVTEAYLSTLADNIVMLRYVELSGQMHRLLGVLKVRGSNHQKELMEFGITNAGMEILGPFKGVENLMTGSARKIQINFNEKNAEEEFIKENKQGKI